MLFLPATLAVAQGREPVPGPNWVFQSDRPIGQLEQVDPAPIDDMYPIELNGNWGLMNQDGEIICFPQFQWTDYGYEGLARAVHNEKTGYITGNGSWVIEPVFDSADRFVDGTAVVGDGQRFGVIDLSGRFVLPMEFDGVLRFQDGFAGVMRHGRCGFVDRRGKVVVPLQFKAVRSFHNGFAAVQTPDGRWGYIDKRGRLVWLDESGRVTLLGDFHEGLARVKATLRDGVERWGYLTLAHRFAIDPAYEDARDFHNGYAAVKIEGKWGYIHRNGRWLIEPQFDEADDFDNAVASNDFLLPSERQRERATPRRTDRRDNQTAGLYAMVRLDGRWGYVNEAANQGLVPQFVQAEPFYLGLARVGRGNSFAYVTERGQVRFDPLAAPGGIVDRTLKDRARQDTVRDTTARQNAVIPPPPARQPYDAPYEPEFRYEEMLPVPE
ncbi:MAG: WG repeat-containing protein [Planctomycetota bacterium]